MQMFKIVSKKPEIIPAKIFKLRQLENLNAKV